MHLTLTVSNTRTGLTLLVALLAVSASPAHASCGGLLQPACPAAPPPAAVPAAPPPPVAPVEQPPSELPPTPIEYGEIERALSAGVPLDGRSTSRRRQAYRRACALMAHNTDLLTQYRKMCLTDARICQLGARTCHRNDRCTTILESFGRSLEHWVAAQRTLDAFVAKRVGPARCRDAIRSPPGALKQTSAMANGYVSMAYAIRDHEDGLYRQGYRRIQRAERRLKLPSNRARLRAFRAGCR